METNLKTARTFPSKNKKWKVECGKNVHNPRNDSMEKSANGLTGSPKGARSDAPLVPILIMKVTCRSTPRRPPKPLLLDPQARLDGPPTPSVLSRVIEEMAS